MTTQVVLADDDRILRQTLGRALAMEDDIELVGEASNGLEAIAMVAEHSPDVLLMDIIMPYLDGIEAARRIRCEAPRTRVIILSVHPDPKNVERAWRAGVHGFVPKQAGVDELLAAIRAVRDGHRYLSPALAQTLAGPLSLDEKDGVDGLSLRRLEVLRLIGRGKSNKEIAAKLSLSVRTVESHVRAILSKLDVTNRTQAALIASREGVLGENP